MDPVEAARARMDARERPAKAATPRQPGAKPKAPTVEQGVPAPNYTLPGTTDAFGGLFGPIYIDDREYAPDLMWPNSIPVYHQMEAGDAQIKGLLMAMALPVRRMLWQVDPNGSEPRVYEHIAEDFNLPVRGGDPGEPSPGTFNHDRHLAHALRAPAYGHNYFERVYEYRDPRDGGDGLMHLKKLGTRPPRTIRNFLVDEHGELLGIVQNVGMLAGDPGTIGGKTIDANSLLAYVWDPADDGDWTGNSLLRPVYRNWLLKERLLRVDAVKHERNGMGVPWIETDAKATGPQIEELARIAQEVRAGTRGGAAGPGKLRMVGVEGTVPETIQSVRYHDEQMAAAFLAMFIQLGKGETGSYSLGQALIDFHAQSIESIADWYVECTQAQIEDAVLVNFGTDVQMPKLCWTRTESAEASLADLAVAVEKELIVVDEEFRAQIGQRFKIAGQTPEQIMAHREQEAAEAPEPPPVAPAPPQMPEGPQMVPQEASAAPEARQPARTELADRIMKELTGPMTWADLARASGTDSKNGTARRARDKLLEEGAILKRRSDGRLAPMAALALPGRELKRNPKGFEVEAAVDFEEMESVYLDAVDQLVSVVRAAQADQIADVVSQVEAAGGDAGKLASISAPPVPPEIIEPILQQVAQKGIASARAERDHQIGGVQAAKAAEPNNSAVEKVVAERAEAASKTLAAGLSAAASKKAAAVSTLAPTEAAEQVGAYLGGLSDAALTEQLGGAVQQAYNTGRRELMAANKPTTVYASEILDQQTCPNCNAVDGTEWPSVAEAETAYPIGGYVECEGGLRCRGTLVAVY